MAGSSSDNTLGIAILGAAHMHAQSVAGYVRQRPGVELRWVWDWLPDRGQALADACEAQATSDLARVLEDPQVRAVMIFSETSRHDELIEAALAAGRHLYVDKPLAITAGRAWHLASCIADSGLLFSSGFVLRRRPHHLLLKRLVQEGALGRITRISHANGHTGALRGWFDHPHPQWFTDDRPAGGGGFLDEGTHSADLVMWVLGRQPVRVTAMVGNATGRYPDSEEFGQGLMAFDDGAIAHISGSWVDAAKAVTLEICGTQGAAVVMGDRELYLTTPHLEGADGRSPWRELPPGLPHPQAVFLDALMGDADASCVAVQDAAAAAAVMATMMQAASQRQWLDLPAMTTHLPSDRSTIMNEGRGMIHSGGGRQGVQPCEPVSGCARGVEAGR